MIRRRLEVRVREVEPSEFPFSEARVELNLLAFPIGAVFYTDDLATVVPLADVARHVPALSAEAKTELKHRVERQSSIAMAFSLAVQYQDLARISAALADLPISAADVERIKQLPSRWSELQAFL